MCPNLYNLPQIYDIAFSWDNAQEISFFKTIFENEVPFPVDHVLEPACGSGRFLRTLPAFGFRITGYDNNPHVVQYAQQSVASAGHQEQVAIVLADMVSAEFNHQFDAAFNSINSFRYLLTDSDVVSHLKVTGSSLREGGVYIVHLNFAQDGDIPGGHPWTMERHGIRVTTSWEILNEDHNTKLSHELATFDVETEKNRQHFEEPHTLRLWFFEDFRDVVQQSECFVIAKIFGEDFEALKDGENPSGELGNVYIVLRKV